MPRMKFPRNKPPPAATRNSKAIAHTIQAAICSCCGSAISDIGSKACRHTCEKKDAQHGCTASTSQSQFFGHRHLFASHICLSSFVEVLLLQCNLKVTRNQELCKFAKFGRKILGQKDFTSDFVRRTPDQLTHTIYLSRAQRPMSVPLFAEKSERRRKENQIVTLLNFYSVFNRLRVK